MLIYCIPVLPVHFSLCFVGGGSVSSLFSSVSGNFDGWTPGISVP